MLKPVFAILLLAFALEFTSAQEHIAVIDTSDYLPYPEGINTNLAIAASEGYVTEIHRLIKLGADINKTDYSGSTPLIYAVSNNKTGAVTALLYYDAETDNYTYAGETALHIAARLNYDSISELLIRKGARVDAPDKYNCTPLHYAAAYNYMKLADILIYYEADIDYAAQDGTTPLMAAVWAGNAAMADLLIQNGARVDLKDNKGFEAIHIAAQNGDTLITRLLIDADAPLQGINNYAYNIECIAARNGDKQYLDFLYNSTTWPDENGKDALNPLSVARNYGHRSIYKMLLEKKQAKKISFSFENVILSAETMICIHDIYTGASLHFVEPLYNIRISTGMDFKPSYTRVLMQEEENIYNQYMDKRYLLWVGASKVFVVKNNIFSGTTSLVTGLKAGYLWANDYKGTYESPGNSFKIVPFLRFERTVGRISAFAGYEYMQTDLYKAGPNWINLGVSYTFHFNRIEAPLKKIQWY